MNDQREQKACFMIEMTIEEAERAVGALQAAGVKFDPSQNMMDVNRGAGGNSYNELATIQDVEAILGAINHDLAGDGTMPLLPQDPESLTLAQKADVLDLALSGLFVWENGSIEERAWETNGSSWSEIVRDYPSLFEGTASPE